MPTRPRPRSVRRAVARWRRALVAAPAAVMALVVGSGCAVLGLDRTPVDVGRARQVLQRAVDISTGASPQAVCTLSPAEASTCPGTFAQVDELVPTAPPRVRCIVPAPDIGPLRGGQVLVLEGVDAAGDAYVTEFVVYDAGDQVGVLDAVWWSGLTIVRYTPEEVEWEFNSDSEACERGGLPVVDGA